jgi:hypothetical protein
MAHPQWHISGDYLETCSCDYVCPCITSNLTARPTHGWCKAALLFDIKQGRYGDLRLDGLGVAVAGYIPGPLVEGYWKVGLIVDERATPPQQEALTAILSGAAGGPMAAFAHFVGSFAGVERRTIRVEKQGMKFSFSIPGVMEQAAEGVGGGNDPDQPLYVDNNRHWANPRLALARATRSILHVFGIDWDDRSGRNNAVYATFDWTGP